MKRTFTLALGFGLLASTLALAQTGGPGGVNAVPSPGVIQGINNQQQTYTAGFIGLVPPASATDTVCIAGSSTKTIAVTRIQLSGTAGTLVSLPVTLVRRVTVATGGTAASTTANPANTIAKHDTGNGTATAVPISYTAVPTITDSSPTYLQTANLTLPVTSAGTSIAPLDWRYGNIAMGEQPLVLRGTAAQLCLNLNTVSVSSGLLTGSITWYEF
jgi:hypothetical protein